MDPDDERAAGEDRRDFLKKALALGVAAPVAGSLLGGGPAYAQRPSDQTPRALSSRQLAGQRVIFSYPGLSVPASLLQQIRAGMAAGVIFFGENISSDTQIRAVVNQLKQAQRESPMQAPLLLMTDQEGGLVRRLPGPPIYSEKQISAASDPTFSAHVAGTNAGNNLAGVGMNVNLAPVLDVFYQPGNFIDQYQRSYSNHASVVTDCGHAFIGAQQARGVAATAKHFPGLGAATRSQNTDLGPVTLRVPLTTLRAKDEVPYPAAVVAGVKLVMVSWAVYTALDAAHPAGLSSTVVQGELRQRIAFRGVTITDALEAGALSSHGTSSQRAFLAARAGMDLLLCSARSVAQGQSVTVGLANALNTGQLNRTGFIAAFNRVTTLRNGVNHPGQGSR